METVVYGIYVIVLFQCMHDMVVNRGIARPIAYGNEYAVFHDHVELYLLRLDSYNVDTKK